MNKPKKFSAYSGTIQGIINLVKISRTRFAHTLTGCRHPCSWPYTFNGNHPSIQKKVCVLPSFLQGNFPGDYFTIANAQNECKVIHKVCNLRW